MSLFILSYLAIYGGAHAYLLARLVNGFRLGAPYPGLLVLLSAFMVLAPILVRVLERYGYEFPAKSVAYLGYLWMGFFFLFLSATVALDLVRGASHLLGWLSRRDLQLGEERLLLSAIGIALAASLYGLFEARSIKVSRISLQSGKIPSSAGRVRIVQISDVHLGLMVGKPRLQRILDLVSALQPDLLVSTGDLVDGQMDGLRGLEAGFAALKPPLGKFAVLGNHEVFAGVAASAAFCASCGFRLLREEALPVSGFLTLAGVDDPAAHRGRGAGAGDRALLAPLPPERYTVFLKHRPKVEPDALGLFDLQLSGHVHKGQIFPFNLITHLAYPVKMGLSPLGAGSFLYVSRGSGTWGPPLRVLAPPEVTVIDLLPATS